MLWTAPELLYKRHAGLNTRKTVPGTQPGDIYGFAIILQEILYRSLPYQATGEQTMVTKGMSVAWAFNDDDDDTVVKITTNKKAVLPQGNRAMPQVFFSVEVRQQHSLQD